MKEITINSVRAAVNAWYAHYTSKPEIITEMKDGREVRTYNHHRVPAPELPELTGVSEKQIDYARDVRSREFPCYDDLMVARLTRILADLNAAEPLMPQVLAMGATEEQALLKLARYNGWSRLLNALFATTAKEILG